MTLIDQICLVHYGNIIRELRITTGLNIPERSLVSLEGLNDDICIHSISILRLIPVHKVVLGPVTFP
jgi:hypothetical protein